MYVSIEGLNGSGSNILVQLLPQRFADRGVPVTLFCPMQPMPDSHPLEVIARQRQDDGFLSALTDARFNHHAQRALADYRERGGILLGDRAILTRYATRWDHPDNADKCAYIRRIDNREFRIGRPDVVLWIDVPVKALLLRLATRTSGEAQETPQRLTAARNAYLNMMLLPESYGLDDMVWRRLDGEEAPVDLVHESERCIQEFVDMAQSSRELVCTRLAQIAGASPLRNGHGGRAA
jgi:thymidylate kinase